MSQKQNNKVVSFRRPPNGGNIGVVIFAAIFIYIIICVFMYFTQKHIESYQVKMGSLSSNNVYKGIALRDEEIISATKSGYINYYAREGQRVGVGNLVYTIDESGKLADYLNTNGEGTTLTDKDLSELKTEILGFVNSFDHEEFASVYDFKNSVQGMVQKLSSANILDNIDKINSSGVSELVSLCTAPATGIVVFSTDGYEQVQLEDMTEKKLSLYRRKHLGYIFQMYNLIPNLTVRENIEVGAYLSDRSLDVDELMRTLEIYEHRNKLPNQISGGQQQRTAIGRAIVKNPDILLCDEPTGALDYRTSKEILKLIETVNRKYGNTIIMVTHNDAIKDMADRVVKLRDGMIRKNYRNEHKLTAAELEW